MTAYGKICLIVVLLSCPLVYAQHVECSAEQYLVGDKEYDNLVSKGSGQLKIHNAREAATAWSAAMQVKFVDMPNYQLYSCLAYAYFKADEMQLALSAMKKAELSLKLLIGEVKCLETATGFSIIEAGEPLKADVNVDEINTRMCGAAYEGHYSQRSFKSVLRDADLIRRYLKIKDIIESSREKKPASQ
jgi:hypothetical protein